MEDAMNNRPHFLVLLGACAFALSGPAISADNSASSGQAANGPVLSGHGQVTAQKKPPLHLSDQQQQTVIADITAHDTHQPTPKDFKPELGKAVPSSIHIHGMPPSVLTDVPELKNYMYVHLDRDIVIVDAMEKKVAALIALPENLVQQSNGTPDEKKVANKAAGELTDLSPEQKHAIYQSAAGEPQPVPQQPLLKGAQVPDNVKLQPLPDNATAQTPPLHDLSYATLQDGRMLLVDPKSHKVAGIITRDEGMGSTPANGNTGSTTGQKK
jgi:hypothetical protein